MHLERSERRNFSFDILAAAESVNVDRTRKRVRIGMVKDWNSACSRSMRPNPDKYYNMQN